MKRNLIIIAVVLIIDQWIKLWVKTNMMLGEDIRIFDWFIIHFTENPGMAFGLSWGGDVGKYILTGFRMIAATLLFFWLTRLFRDGVVAAAQIAISLIFAGAVGNLMDSLFYGIIFDHSYHQVAMLFPDGGGYAPFMLGKVVDMFYFPLIDTTLPEWMPYAGGERFVFFRPVFNFADASITAGVTLLIIYQKHVFKES